MSATPAPAQPPPATAKPGPAPWDRQPGESAKSFAAWKCYRSMDANKRSLPGVSRKCRKSVSLLNRWSARWHWQERLAAWDQHVADVERRALDEEAKARAQEWANREQAHRQRRFDLGQKMLAKADEILAMPVKKSKRGKGLEASLHQAARVADVGDKLTSLAVGLPTGATEHTGPDGAPAVVQAGTVVLYLPEKEKLPDEKK